MDELKVTPQWEWCSLHRSRGYNHELHEYVWYCAP